jgi:hypothetical protein
MAGLDLLLPSERLALQLAKLDSRYRKGWALRDPETGRWLVGTLKAGEPWSERMKEARVFDRRYVTYQYYEWVAANNINAGIASFSYVQHASIDDTLCERFHARWTPVWCKRATY